MDSLCSLRTPEPEARTAGLVLGLRACGSGAPSGLEPVRLSTGDNSPPHATQHLASHTPYTRERGIPRKEHKCQLAWRQATLGLYVVQI